MSKYNEDIHNELLEFGDCCPFCDQKIGDCDEKPEKNLVNDLYCDKKWKFLKKKNQRIVLVDDLCCDKKNGRF